MSLRCDLFRPGRSFALITSGCFIACRKQIRRRRWRRLLWPKKKGDVLYSLRSCLIDSFLLEAGHTAWPKKTQSDDSVVVSLR